jgi:ribosomal protein L37AE/L43A
MHIYVCPVCAKNKAFERENKHITIFKCNLCWSKFQIFHALGTVIGIGLITVNNGRFWRFN